MRKLIPSFIYPFSPKDTPEIENTHADGFHTSRHGPLSSGCFVKPMAMKLNERQFHYMSVGDPERDGRIAGRENPPDISCSSDKGPVGPSARGMHLGTITHAKLKAYQ